MKIHLESSVIYSEDRITYTKPILKSINMNSEIKSGNGPNTFETNLVDGWIVSNAIL